MLSYTYTARNPSSGQRVTATVEADSEQSAAKLIRAEGLVPIEITVDKSALTTGLLGRFNRVRSKDKVIFSRQLATLLNAGLPLIQSLRNVNGQTQSKPLKVIVSKIIADVEAGSTLAKAMGKYPDVFNQVYISMIAAGEASGTLDKALERLADQQEKDADIAAKVRGAMIYPADRADRHGYCCRIYARESAAAGQNAVQRNRWRCTTAAGYANSAGLVGLGDPVVVADCHHLGYHRRLYVALGPDDCRQAHY